MKKLNLKQQLELQIGEPLYKIDGMFMTMNQSLIYKLNKENQKGI